MDLGRFERSRAQFWLWIGVPLALLAVAGLPSVLYLRHAERALSERQVLQAAVPRLQEQVLKADDLLERVTPSEARMSEARDAASRRLDDAARRAGLTVRSVKVEENIEEEESLRTARITMQVQGSLPALVQWLDDVQKPGLLISVEEAGIHALANPPADALSGAFTFVLHLRPS